VSKTPPKEVSPTTAFVAILVALLAVFLTYAHLLRPSGSGQAPTPVMQR